MTFKKSLFFNSKGDKLKVLNKMFLGYDYNQRKRLMCSLCSMELLFKLYQVIFFCACANYIYELINQNVNKYDNSILFYSILSHNLGRSSGHHR